MFAMNGQLDAMTGWQDGASASLPPSTTVTTGVFVEDSMSLIAFWTMPELSAELLVAPPTASFLHWSTIAADSRYAQYRWKKSCPAVAPVPAPTESPNPTYRLL